MFISVFKYLNVNYVNYLVLCQMLIFSVYLRYQLFKCGVNYVLLINVNVIFY